MFLGHFVWYGESKWRDITERLHTAGGSALSSSVLRQSSPQDITEHFYGVTLALLWHYYVQRRPSQHYDTLDVTDIKDNATCCGLLRRRWWLAGNGSYHLPPFRNLEVSFCLYISALGLAVLDVSSHQRQSHFELESLISTQKKFKSH